MRNNVSVCLDDFNGYFDPLVGVACCEFRVDASRLKGYTPRQDTVLKLSNMFEFEAARMNEIQFPHFNLRDYCKTFHVRFN